MKKLSLNPLKGIFESSAYPMARIYRTNVWTGLLDTFQAIVGNHYLGNFKIGVLDILILPLISRQLIMPFLTAASEPSSLRVIAAIFGGFIEVPRFILGAALTLALSPIVALVHGFSYFKAKKLKMAINVHADNPSEKLVDIATSDHFLKAEYNSTKKMIDLFKGDKLDWVDKYLDSSRLANSSQFPKDPFTSVRICQENADVIKGLLGTNSFGVTQLLEGVGDRLENVRDEMSRPRM